MDGYETKLKEMEDLLQTYIKNLTPLIRSVTSSVPGRMKFRNQSTPILPCATTQGGMLIRNPEVGVDSTGFTESDGRSSTISMLTVPSEFADIFPRWWLQL